MVAATTGPAWRSTRQNSTLPTAAANTPRARTANNGAEGGGTLTVPDVTGNSRTPEHRSWAIVKWLSLNVESGKKIVASAPASAKHAAAPRLNTTPTPSRSPPGESRTATPPTPRATAGQAVAGVGMRRSRLMPTANRGVAAHSTATMEEGMLTCAAAALTDAAVVRLANTRIRSAPPAPSRANPRRPHTRATARTAAPTRARPIAISPGEKAVRATSVTL